MKKLKLYFLFILSLFILISLKDSYSQTGILQEDKPNLILTGETALVKTGALDINITTVRYGITGDALQFTSENTDNREEGYTYTFKGIKSGDAEITLNLTNLKKGEEGIITKVYKVKVINVSELPKVNAVDIFNNPKNYTGILFVMEGINRGWGLPVNAKEIRGKVVTRSDWVFEDSTGALYVTGLYKPEKEGGLKIIGGIVLDENNEWAFYGYKILLPDDNEIQTVSAIDIYNNPKKYTDGLFVLEGTSRGWGKPVNTTVIWGKKITKSDWVFEDNTGALNITGIFMAENGAEIKITGNVVMDENGEWTFYGNKVIPKKSTDSDVPINSLNGKWILRTINGKEAVKAESAFGGMPYFEFNLDENKAVFFDGCNDLYEKIAVTDNEIIFSFINMTKINCNESAYVPGLGELGLESKKNTINFTIENNVLTLSKGDTINVTLIKQ